MVNSNFKYFFFILFCFLSIFSSFEKGKNIIYIAAWHTYLPQKYIDEFCEKNNVTIVFDPINSQEYLESKLLGRTSGYDLVISSIWPNFEVDVKGGMYLKIDKNQINCVTDEAIKNIIGKEAMNYCVPYVYGNTGFLYVGSEKVQVSDFFCIEKLQKISQKGKITFLDSADEFFPLCMKYLNIDYNAASKEDLLKTYKHMLQMRPFISEFTNNKQMSLFQKQEIIAAQGWSDQAACIQQNCKNVKYTFDENNVPIWIDAFALPYGSKNIHLVYKFINFICEKEKESFIQSAINANRCTSVDINEMQNIIIDKRKDKEFEELKIRLWYDFKSHE